MSVVTTGWTEAKEGGHPQVIWACVKDNLEFLEGVFQWWCYPQRISTGRRREWISTELATLYSHTAASLWVLHILWDQFITTVQLTAFDHKGTYIWYFFLCCILCRISVLWPGVEMVPPAWEAQRHNHWASRTTGHPGKSWFLHLRSSVVSSNPALSRRSFLINPSHFLQTQTTSNQHHTGDSFIWHIFILSLSLRLAWAFLKTK